ncbi:MotA/TolQ/ExbB proton channel family protein [Burkholderiales bacterium]|nr:MotA/TolQ/ExbB proton channel family protein [Burkholderiales bacterium]
MSSRLFAARKSGRMIWLKCLMGLALLCAPLLATAWWNGDWAYRKKITLDGAETPALGGQVQQVLLPIRLHAGNFLFFDAQQSGADLRFVAADDKTPLNFHIEQFDPINEIAIVWVQVPSVGAKDSAVYLYYGNPQAAAAGNVAKASFDPHTVAAFHFAEREGLPRDATGYGNNASSSSGSQGAAGASGFGLGLSAVQSLRIPATPSLATLAGSGWTVMLWAKTAEAAATGTILSRSEADKALVFGLEGGKPYLALADGTRKARVAADKPIDGGTWHHLAFTLADKARLYVDGQEVASGALQAPELKGDVLIGAGAAGGGLAAEIDELQISNLARAADWVRAAAVGQDPQSKLVQYGGDESGGGNDYLAVIRTLANAVSLDGWIIIGFIGVLGLFSMEVMVTKMRTIVRMRRQNEEFLGVFRDASSPLAQLDADAANAKIRDWSESPLFHLFHRGINEVFSVQKLTGGVMTPQAFEVVRAGLEATMVEESHRLNNRLVLLTLSVSGAPFLGLLGTVVGIMITFASIAMAGDVNVNTIAPGVAAALTATVSGLVVAIPVLFGYNFLATRIRELTTGMEVFANEILGKLALRSSLAELAGTLASAPALQAVAA